MRRLRLEELRPSLAENLEKVEEELARASGSSLLTFREGAAHVLGGRGKRLRPIITLLSAEACGEVRPEAIICAAVVELVHTASLVHDDVIDDSRVRRGEDSAKSVWGNKRSILLGDFLLNRAFSRILELGEPELLRRLAVVADEMCHGEMAEVEAAGGELAEEAYLEIISAKTASLFSLSAVLGAGAADGRQEWRERLATYGRQFGLAFQIADDILDLVGDTGSSGKPTGHDLADRKLTLPLIRMLEAGSERERKAVRALLAAEVIGEAELMLGRRLALEGGGVDYAWQKATAHLAAASAALEALPGNGGKRALQLLLGEVFPLPVLA